MAADACAGWGWAGRRGPALGGAGREGKAVAIEVGGEVAVMDDVHELGRTDEQRKKIWGKRNREMMTGGPH